MEFTVTLDYWMTPLLITIAAYVWAFVPRKHDDNSMGYYLLGRLVIAGVLTIVAWVMTAVLK